MFSLIKKEMRAEVQRMIAEASGITGYTKIRGKSYPEWMEQKSYRQFSIRTERLLHTEAQKIILFIITLDELAFKLFEGLPEGSIMTLLSNPYSRQR